VIAKRKGVTVRWGLKEAWSKRTSRCTRTESEAYGAGRVALLSCMRLEPPVAGTAWASSSSARGTISCAAPVRYLPTHGSERSRQSFSVDTAKNVWACQSAFCCEARQGRVGGNVLDLVAWLERCSIRDEALRLQDGWCGWRAGIDV
jgi:hypothetical protein